LAFASGFPVPLFRSLDCLLILPEFKGIQVIPRPLAGPSGQFRYAAAAIILVVPIVLPLVIAAGSIRFIFGAMPVWQRRNFP